MKTGTTGKVQIAAIYFVYLLFKAFSYSQRPLRLFCGFRCLKIEKYLNSNR